MAKKAKTKDEKLHHIISNTGMGKKATNYEVIPLCPHHHRNSEESYHYSPKKFDERWGTQEDLLKETLERKAEQEELQQVF